MFSIIKKFIPNRVKRNAKHFARNIVVSFCYYGWSGKSLLNIQPPVNGKISSVIFVCKGNVCRSTFAEQRLRNLLGTTRVQVDSCGIDVDQGNFPPEDSVAVAAEFSCALDGRRAKGLHRCDIAGADLICPMEYWQYKRLIQLYPEKKKNILLLRNLAPFPYRLFCNITDPYGWGRNEFRRVFRLIDRSLVQIKQWC
jgi:protein-tyrosine phosphatase